MKCISVLIIFLFLNIFIFPQKVNISGNIFLEKQNDNSNILIVFNKKAIGLKTSFYSGIIIGSYSYEEASTLYNSLSDSVQVSKVAIFNGQNSLVAQSTDPSILNNNWISPNSSIGISISHVVPHLLTDVASWYTLWYCQLGNYEFIIRGNYGNSFSSSSPIFSKESISDKTIANKETFNIDNKIRKFTNFIIPANYKLNYKILSTQDSVLTDQNGFFNTQIDSGVYDISISKQNFNSNYLNNYLIFTSRVISTDTLTIIDTPNIVQQVSPLNSSLGNIQPVQLKWMSSLRASSYGLQFSSDSTFATTITDTTGLTDTTLTISGQSNLTKYYWRVNASNVGGTSQWSQIWRFKTLGNPTQAVIVYPTVNSVNVPVTVNFKWDKSQDQLMNAQKNIFPLLLQIKNKTASPSGIKDIATVSQYWFELITDTTNSSYVVKDTTLTDTSRQVSALHTLTNYWWRVKAMNEAGWGAFTSWSKFTTIVDTPGAAILISPNSSSNISDSVSSILFTWHSAPLASKYELQVGSDQNFGTIVADTTGITDTVYTYHSKNLPKTFNWRIRGSNAAGAGSWSNSMAVSLITGINGMSSGIPIVYQLMQNYPNPFNPSSKIRYALPFSSNVKIEIYNILGEKIKELVNEQKNTGYYEVNFNTTGLASGVYFYMIEAKSIDGKNEFRDTKKMMLLK